MTAVRSIVLGAAVLLAFPAFAHALSVTPGQTIVLTTTTPSPSVTGQTMIDHKVSTFDLVVPYAGTSVTSYRQLTVQLVTNVYRNPGGTLAFAYNVAVQDFPTPAPGTPVMGASLPSLRLAHFGSFATNAHAENMPNAAPSGVVNPKRLSVMRSADGDNLHYLFATGATGLIHQDNTLFPPQIEASTPAVVFVETDATDYIDFGATVETHSFNTTTPGSFTTAFLTFDSFAPQAETGAPAPAPVPEPLALLMLPLAIGALGLRRRVT